MDFVKLQNSLEIIASCDIRVAVKVIQIRFLIVIDVGSDFGNSLSKNFFLLLLVISEFTQILE